jgi:S-adenosylmethionine-dependent methyltransferase
MTAVRATLNDADRAALERALGDALCGRDRPPDPHTIHVHLMHRLTESRNNVMPWVAEYVDLAKARVLEIGTGTGSSLVAFAELGATVDAIDINAVHMEAARTRAELFGVQASFYVMNATDLATLYEKNRYDLIFFSATLEHMTVAERLQCLREAWEHLAPGGVLCIYDTPNRLWYVDTHTTLMPFYNWLPDELAVPYAKRTHPGHFENVSDDFEIAARLGRGVSYHEFELSFGLDPAGVGKSMHESMCERFPPFREKWDASREKRYYDLLGDLVPLPGPWREEFLNLIIQK